MSLVVLTAKSKNLWGNLDNAMRLKSNKGQSSVEYIIMVAFGAFLSIEVAKFFNEVFRDGLLGLERNVQTEMQTGKGYK